jgi:hypothetical protein
VVKKKTTLAFDDLELILQTHFTKDWHTFTIIPLCMKSQTQYQKSRYVSCIFWFFQRYQKLFWHFRQERQMFRMSAGVVEANSLPQQTTSLYTLHFLSNVPPVFNKQLLWSEHMHYVPQAYLRLTWLQFHLYGTSCQHFLNPGPNVRCYWRIVKENAKT